MSKDEVNLALKVLDLRDRIIFRLAVLVGMRPGEVFALRWGRRLDSQTIWRPMWSNGAEFRKTPAPMRWCFRPSAARFLSRDNFLRRNIQQKLEKVGLGWVNFQALRRTQASLSHKEKIDAKVAADQRGHDLGVAMNTYIQSDLQSHREAVTQLEAQHGQLTVTFGGVARTKATEGRTPTGAQPGVYIARNVASARSKQCSR